MKIHMVFIVAVMLLPSASSMRVKANKGVQGEEDLMESVQANQTESDLQSSGIFDFMTKDLRYPGHDSGFFGSISEFFGDRAVNDVKEEIVVGHACQRRGDRDQTYYASSYCYWLPEFKELSGSKAANSGLLWSGGAYPRGKSLGNALQGSGKCLKLSACHNNARGEGGSVDKTSFVEEMALPAGCMKEKEIEAQCVSEYNDDVEYLKVRHDMCLTVQSTYDDAMAKYRRCTGFLESLPLEISQYPQRIRQAEHDEIRAETRWEGAQDAEYRERDQMRRRCDQYERLKGWHHFDRWNNDRRAEGLSMTMWNSVSTHCVSPHRPMKTLRGGGARRGQGSNPRRPNPNYHAEMRRYEQDRRLHTACQECEHAKNDLRNANTNTANRLQEYRRSQQKVPNLRQERQQKKEELRTWEEREPMLRQVKDEASLVWLPQEHECKQLYAEYKTGKARAVATCAPKFYDESCERECVSLQAQDGCGVVEGAFPQDASGMGGVSVQCVPPQPSWILAPFTYGQREDSTEQCKRIEANQKAEYTQGVMKAGWLWKKGGSLIDLNGKWDKRYFVLEAGNDVRSAVLRYWNADPTKNSRAEESGSKGIVLHDAKKVKAKSGRHYGFDDGSECFKLYHFYRDFRLCVVVQTGNSQALQERDEWLDLVGSVVGQM